MTPARKLATGLSGAVAALGWRHPMPEIQAIADRLNRERDAGDLFTAIALARLSPLSITIHHREEPTFLASTIATLEIHAEGGISEAAGYSTEIRWPAGGGDVTQAVAVLAQHRAIVQRMAMAEAILRGAGLKIGDIRAAIDGINGHAETFWAAVNDSRKGSEP